MKHYIRICDWQQAEVNRHYPFVNPALGYAYDALEPYIDTATMHAHHDRHLQGYVDRLNAALHSVPSLHDASLEQLLTHQSELPANARTEILNNAGGVYCHIMYFDSLSAGGSPPSGRFAQRIKLDFGSVDQLLAALNAAALSVFGSGYAWLVEMPGGRLAVTTSANQDTPLPDGHNPLLPVDVWEHAYYLKRLNQRGEYLNALWRVVDFDAVAKRCRVD